jgi:ParB-like chromosome segregation protein Spo0J
VSRQAERNIVRIPISSVRADENNPRKTFQEVDEFADSIHTAYDIEVPIIVEDLGGKNYFLVDGERRLRAAKKAGLTSIWADVRDSLNDVERGILRAKLNFQHWNWETAEGVKQLNGLYDAWLETQGQKRLIETKGMRQKFARLIGISEGSLGEKLRFGDTAARSIDGKVPALEALREEKMTFEAARKIAGRDPVVQQAIIERAEKIAKRQEAPVITKKELLQAKAEYEVRKPTSKAKRDQEAIDDIRKSYLRITDQTAVIRDRAKFLFNADSARATIEMLDALGDTIVAIEGEVVKRFPAVKPRRGSK